MTEMQIRCIPRNEEHSVAWCIWRIARIEDVTMNMLVAGKSQILFQDNWLDQMNLSIIDTGNAMSEEDVAGLINSLDNIEVLKEYCMAVGRRTQEIVQKLTSEVLKQRVDPIRIQQVIKEGAVVIAAKGVIDYWSRRTIAGLLLIPATRHNLIHLNEAFRLKEKRY